jgi:putative inorganic carbon (HCO3(-)) transporter
MNYRETTGSVENPYLKTVLVLVLGVASVILAVSLADYGFKPVFAVSAILAVVVYVSFFPSQRTLVKSSLIFLGLGIPFNLDVNLFLRPYVGVASVDIGVSLLCAMALYVLFFYEHVTKHTEVLFRYNRSLFWAPLLYMMAGFLSFYNAASPELVILELVRLTMLFLIFFIIMNLRNKEQIATFVLSLSIGIVFEALIVFYQYTTGRALGLGVLGEKLYPLQLGYMTRAGGTIGHPNLLGYYFEMLVPLMLAMSIVEEKGLRKLWYMVAALCGLLGMIATMSRGSWITVPISLPLVFFVAYGRRLTQTKTYMFLLPGVLAVLILFFLFVVPMISPRLTFGDPAARSRIPLNAAAFSIVKQFPVTGVGLNNLGAVFRTYDTTGGSAVFTSEGGNAQFLVHNIYLWVWSETGTIGLITFAGIFLSAFYVGLKTLFAAQPWQRGVLIGAVSGLLAQTIHGLVDPGFRVLMSTSMLFYSLIGLIGAVALTSAADKEQTGS